MLIYLRLVTMEILLLLSCCIGDYLLLHPIKQSQLLTAATDSLTHGIVGAFSWAIICDVKFTRQTVLECFLCGLLAMSVDIDHFLSAKSFHLKDALSLPRRPPFHATTVIILVDLVLITLSFILDQKFLLGAYLFTTAWFSHHVRDGHRRGLWFYPFGDTSPIPQYYYLFIIFIFPLITRFIYLKFYKPYITDRVIELDAMMV
ncbi:hypothetical protein ACF0H5_011463 [Mactra antiquata]